MQDVSEEHARKTITVDPFPHTAVRSASIHPCKHAAVMQKLGALAETGGKPFRVERRAAPAAPLLSCAFLHSSCSSAVFCNTASHAAACLHSEQSLACFEDWSRRCRGVSVLLGSGGEQGGADMVTARLL